MTANGLTVATWNVNSIRARIDNVIQWLNLRKPDIVCLQEIKTTEETFPFLEIESCGYQVTVVGQKSYNGVAVLTKDAKPDTIHHTHLPALSGAQYEDMDNPQARYIEIGFKGARVAGLYLPNGNPVDTDKFSYKLEWMERLYHHMRLDMLYQSHPVILCGDFNVIPREIDCYAPDEWRHDALFHPQTVAAFQRLKHLGFYDAFESLYPLMETPYTFWDYQAGCWPQNKGLRIDHFLLNSVAMDRLSGIFIDKDERDREKASDHVPVILTLSVE